jgi:hypothetical protein
VWLDDRVLGVLPALLLATILATGMVEIRSTTNCPSSAEVTERLRPLLPRGPATGSLGHRATLDVVQVGPDGTVEMRLRMLRADASVIGDRPLFLRGGCQDMAEAIAAVIAAWESEPGRESSAGSPVSDDGVTAASPAAALPPARIQVSGGVGVGAGLVGGLAAVGNLEMQFGRADSRWQLRFGMMAERSRQLDLGPGQVDWRHTMVAAGLLLRGSVSSWVGSLDAGPVAGWATNQGKGYGVDRQDSSFEVGVASGVRAGRQFGRWALWAEARGNLWLRGQRVLLTGSPATADLPRGDVSIGLGTTVRLF